MNEFIEICGTPIEIKTIKDFRIVKKEYIYRPVFREVAPKNFFSSAKYEFETMEPYAAIVDEGKTSPLQFWKNLDSSNRKYDCVNAAGRKFSVSLDDVPILVHLPDGHTAEVHKGDVNFRIMGRDKTPYIEMVDALVIQAKEKYIFYGNNIHLFSVLENYSRVKDALTKAGLKGNDTPLEPQNSPVPEIQPAPSPAKKSFLSGLVDNVSGAVGSIAGTVGDMINSNKKSNDQTSSEEPVVFPTLTQPVPGTPPQQAFPTPAPDMVAPTEYTQPSPEALYSTTQPVQPSYSEPSSQGFTNTDSTKEELRALKQRYESGEISRDEFNLAMNRFIDEL